MSRHRRQLGDALAAVSVRGPTRFAWMGRLEPGIDAPVEAAMDAEARRIHLVGALAERLRRSWYCHGHTIPSRRSAGAAFAADQALLASLSAANCGRGTWAGGWTVERLDGDSAVCSDGALRVRVGLDALDGPARPGTAVAVRMPKELPFYAPGFLHMLGDARLDGGPDLVRAYWHVTERGAVPLVRMLTSLLNAGSVPFELKVVSHPLEFQRADAAVLYLPAAHFDAVREQLAAVARETGPFLRPQVPTLTFELAPGVGLAESLRRAESFGSRRCALVAEGIVRAHERGGPLLDGVLAAFAEAGVDPDAPYREPALEGRHVL